VREDILFLKCFGAAVILGIGCLFTIAVPVLTLEVGLVVLSAGVLWRSYTTLHEGRKTGGGIVIMVVGALLTCPPILYITAGLIAYHTR